MREESDSRLNFSDISMQVCTTIPYMSLIHSISSVKCWSNSLYCARSTSLCFSSEVLGQFAVAAMAQQAEITIRIFILVHNWTLLILKILIFSARLMIMEERVIGTFQKEHWNWTGDVEGMEWMEPSSVISDYLDVKTPSPPPPMDPMMWRETLAVEWVGMAPQRFT